MTLTQKTIEGTRHNQNDQHIAPAKDCQCRTLMSCATRSLVRSIRLKCGRAVLLSVLSFVALPSITSAQAIGIWDFTNNGCFCKGQLTISTWDDGSPVGAMTCPGSQSSVYNILIDGDHISFSVYQEERHTFVTYDYDANVTGDNMNGTCTNTEAQSDRASFAAKRRRQTNGKMSTIGFRFDR